MMPDLDSIITLLNNGGFAVMSVAFIAGMVMMWKKDARAERTLLMLKDRDEDAHNSGIQLDAMMSVVSHNSEVLEALRGSVDANTATLTRLNGDLDRRMSDIVQEIRSRR